MAVQHLAQSAQSRFGEAVVAAGERDGHGGVLLTQVDKSCVWHELRCDDLRGTTVVRRRRG
ncbi:hypothetical protein GCM10009838_11870 [Catenulispora subtropica]|uniref:Uncharacterized protein n=1 Tax=Catenulispora subtropica TaxID=450798 RepID=A0ABP5C410_9ACTN